MNKKTLLLTLGGLASASAAFATISYSTQGGTYSENFAGLLSVSDSDAWTDNSTIAGWYSDQTIIRDEGAGSGINAFSDGVDHAFGSRAVTAIQPIYGAGFVNNTGGTLTDITISFLQEQYYAGISGEVVDFQYHIGDISDVDAAVTWTDFNALDLVSTDNTNSGNTLAGNSNQTSLSETIAGVTWNNGDEFWIRFVDTDTAGGLDSRMAVDSFALSAVPEPSTYALLSGMLALTWVMVRRRG